MDRFETIVGCCVGFLCFAAGLFLLAVGAACVYDVVVHGASM